MIWHRPANSSPKRRSGCSRQVTAVRGLSLRLGRPSLAPPAAAAANRTVASETLQNRPAHAGASIDRARMSDQLVDLIYELLDAHNDTARLAGNLLDDQRWETHLAYLRDLQRVGRETLVHMSLKEQT
jgi:hypothetical protein